MRGASRIILQKPSTVRTIRTTIWGTSRLPAGGDERIFFPVNGEMVGTDNPVDHESPFVSVLSPGKFIQNLVGASVRWSYGTVWRTLSGKKRYTLTEYMYGPKYSDDWFDQKGHTFVNRIIGMVFIVVVFVLLLKSC